jgi:hypothetical protein
VRNFQGAEMKKKPDLIVLIIVVFGMGVTVNAVGQALGGL